MKLLLKKVGNIFGTEEVFYPYYMLSILRKNDYFIDYLYKIIAFVFRLTQIQIYTYKLDFPFDNRKFQKRVYFFRCKKAFRKIMNFLLKLPVSLIKSNIF